MSIVIEQAFQQTPFLLQWYTWGVFASLVIAIGSALWIFLDTQQTSRDAAIWKALAAASCVLAVPAVVARLDASFAVQIGDSLAPIAYVSIGALLLAVAAVVAYAMVREQPMLVSNDGWSADSTIITQSSVDVAIVSETEAPEPVSSERPTLFPTEDSPMVARSPQGFGDFSQPRRETVILKRDDSQPALAFLVVRSGSYKNTTFPLKTGVTRLGRNGQLNDHAIDDDAVSDQHLSIRYQEQEGTFVLTDLDSTNGTLVNDKKVDRQVLASNDTITIGHTQLVFMQVPGKAPKAEA